MRAGGDGTSSEAAAARLYLDLMKRTLTRSGFVTTNVELRARNRKRHVLAPLQRALKTRGYRLVTTRAVDGKYEGETMIGPKRLDNLQECVETVIADDVPGDLIETGTWRGGAAIFMRAVLAAYSVTDRLVWVADSFAGFPTDEHRGHAVDKGVDFTAGLGDALLSVDLDTVTANFERYGLLDDQVRFLVGWFADTLPTAPIAELAVLRLDGDLYESTWDSLSALYPKLSVGGYVIVDDYGFWDACRQAVDDYRAEHDIADPIEEIDGEAVYWRRA